MHTDNLSIHIHHKSNSMGSCHADEAQHYLHNVAAAIKDVQSILITGPAKAKTQLAKHIQHHDPLMRKEITGVETFGHPSDGKLVDFARSFFKSDHQIKARDI